LLKKGQVKPLAARQRDVFQLLARITEALKEPPTVEYLARQLKVHRKTVQQHLDALFAKGWLSSPTPAGLRCTHRPG
jgi:predicted ArsR family transcriptional regulator